MFILKFFCLCVLFGLYCRIDFAQTDTSVLLLPFGESYFLCFLPPLWSPFFPTPPTRVFLHPTSTSLHLSLHPPSCLSILCPAQDVEVRMKVWQEVLPCSSPRTCGRNHTARCAWYITLWFWDSPLIFWCCCCWSEADLIYFGHGVLVFQIQGEFGCLVVWLLILRRACILPPMLTKFTIIHLKLIILLHPCPVGTRRLVIMRQNVCMCVCVAVCLWVWVILLVLLFLRNPKKN